MSESAARSASSQILPYVLPYFLYVAIGALADPRTHAELAYSARLLAVGGALAFFWREYRPLTGPRAVAGSLFAGVVAGLAGTGLWVALRLPFPAGSPAPWSDSAWLARALGSTALPPFAEELLFRGFALRVILLWERARAERRPLPFQDALERSSLADVAPGAWSALAVLGSSVLFAAGHTPAEWVAASAYGVLMCALWIARGDLVSCICAHAVTNAALALYVRASGQWGSW